VLRGKPSRTVGAKVLSLLVAVAGAVARQKFEQKLYELKSLLAQAVRIKIEVTRAERQVLERRREQKDRLPPLTLTLPDNDKARNIVVRAPSLAAYDQLDADADADAEDDTEQTNDNNS